MHDNNVLATPFSPFSQLLMPFSLSLSVYGNNSMKSKSWKRKKSENNKKVTVLNITPFLTRAGNPLTIVFSLQRCQGILQSLSPIYAGRSILLIASMAKLEPRQIACTGSTRQVSNCFYWQQSPLSSLRSRKEPENDKMRLWIYAACSLELNEGTRRLLF